MDESGPGLSNRLASLVEGSPRLRNLSERLYGLVPAYMGAGRALPPLSATVLLTYRCNCRCSMCFYYNPRDREATLRTVRRRKADELTTSDLLSLTDELSESGVRVVSLHGGEPLVHPGFFDIARRARGAGLIVHVVTNGVLIDGPGAGELVRMGLDSITVSIDGLEPTHDAIRGPGTFRGMLSGARALSRARKDTGSSMRLNVSTYLTGTNYTEFPEVISLAAELGFDFVGAGIVTHCDADAVASTCSTLGGLLVDGSSVGGLQVPEEMARFDTGALSEAVSEACERARRENIGLVVPSDEAVGHANDPGFNELGRCVWPWSRVTVSPYGEVFPCVNFGTEGLLLGNVRESSFREIWNGPAARRFRNAMRRQGTVALCAKCCAVNPGVECASKG